jgi:hypothetical protein
MEIAKRIPYTRAKGKTYAKNAKGFHIVDGEREYIPVVHPPRVMTPPKERGEPTVIDMKRGQIAGAKQAAAHARRQARGNHVTIDASIRKLKHEMREIMRQERAKRHERHA